MSLRMRGNIILLIAAFIWGTTFVAQMVGMDGMGPFTYAGARYFLGFFSLLATLYFFRGNRAKAKKNGTYRSGFKMGAAIGLVMFVATSLQQVAMLYTTAGKTAFITALYIILVPLAAVFFLKERIKTSDWIGAVLAVTGLYLLSVRGDFSVGMGDAIVLASTIFWTGHILLISRFAAKVDPIELSTGQVFTCAALSLTVALIFENIDFSAVQRAWFAIFYGGVLSAGVAFTLQIIGQKYAEPSHAAIIMSFEAIFGALSAWVILGEVMSGKEIFGCVLMSAGVIVTQVDWERKFL